MGTEYAINLQMDGTMQRNLQVYAGALVEAEAYAIDSIEMAGLANGELRSIIERKKEVKEWKAGFISPAKLIIGNAERLFDPAIEALENAEGYIKGLLKSWTLQEEIRIAGERRQIEDDARRIRQAAEQTAAAERARAEEQAAQERRKAEAAQQARLEAEAEAAKARAAGDKQAAAAADKQAAAAAAESAKREEMARAKQEEGEAKATEAELSAMATIQAAVPVAAAVVPSGFGLRDNWIAEVAIDETMTILAIAAALAARPELVSLLKLDLSAASKMAKALKHNANLPGLIVRNDRISTSRKA